MQHLQGFPPSAAPDARVLVLGSMPSRESLRRGQYYAHPRNAFWPIMAALFGFAAEQPYEERLERLRASGVALWDVAHTCIRPGSLDADMRKITANDFAPFFATQPHLRAVFFNGRKAEALYKRLVLPQLPRRLAALPAACLPSTSPAHAALAFEEKLAAWEAVRRALESVPA